MQITWDFLFERIKSDPIEHLGGYSPKLLLPYFSGYEHALAFHSQDGILGGVSPHQIGQWFINNVNGGPQNYASICLLVTDSEEQALELFFEFRQLVQKDIANLKPDTPTKTSQPTSFLDMIQNPETLKKRPAMYLGNDQWTRHLWTMWKGYVDAEKDIGIEKSRDTTVFWEFSKWLDERYPFSLGKNWGKLFQFLALDVHANAQENFFDHLELFLSGGSPQDNTRRFQQFLDDAVAAVKQYEGERGQSATPDDGVSNS